MTPPTDDAPHVPPLDNIHALDLELAPERDLFPEIHARIAPRSPWRDAMIHIVRFRRAWLALTAVGAAALVLLVVRPATMRPDSTDAPPTVASDAPKTRDGNPINTPAGDKELDAALQTYRDAGDQLLRALKARRANIPDAVWRDIEQSLADVDRALGAIKTVMEQSPDDPRLLSFALSAHAQRVALLSRLVRTFPLS